MALVPLRGISDEVWVLNTVHVLGKKKLGRPLGFGAVPIQLNLHVQMYYVDLHVCGYTCRPSPRGPVLN